MRPAKRYAVATVLAVLLVQTARPDGPFAAPAATWETAPGIGLAPQAPAAPEPVPPAPAYGPAPGDAAAEPPRTPALDDWIAHRQPHSCFCPLGGDGPIQTELYLRSGTDVPVGGGVYGRVLTPGWAIGGGGRVFFFEPDMTTAWVVDLGILNVNNHADRPDVQVPLTVLVPNGFGGTTLMAFGQNGVPGVTIRDWNRTFASAGLGKEWWCGLPASAPGSKLRWGLDVGGRWGSSKGDFNEIRHRTDVIGAAYGALHTDLEWRCGCGCTFLLGARVEYSYTWSDILQSEAASNTQDILALVNFGVRF